MGLADEFEHAAKITTAPARSHAEEATQSTTITFRKAAVETNQPPPHIHAEAATLTAVTTPPPDTQDSFPPAAATVPRLPQPHRTAKVKARSWRPPQ